MCVVQPRTDVQRAVDADSLAAGEAHCAQLLGSWRRGRWRVDRDERRMTTRQCEEQLKRRRHMRPGAEVNGETRSRTLTASARRLPLHMTGPEGKGLQMNCQKPVGLGHGYATEDSFQENRQLTGHPLAHGEHFLMR